LYLIDVRFIAHFAIALANLCDSGKGARLLDLSDAFNNAADPIR
jgi:hypothetical protein